MTHEKKYKDIYENLFKITRNSKGKIYFRQQVNNS